MTKYGGLYAIGCVIAVLLWYPPSFACNVCHSKNPKMVRMHTELGYKDCFTCHMPGKRKSPEEWNQQRESDEKCIRCHKK